MGNKNSVIKKYYYISYYKIKLLNLNFNDNKIYVLLFPKYLLFVDKNGEEIYKYTVTGNTTRVNASSRTQPKKALIQSNSFSGILSWTVTEQ